MYEFEQKLWAQGHTYVAGCDEVGRGPLAGPVVASAVVLDPLNPIKGLDDSKKLTEKRRNELFQEIKQKALGVSTVFISAGEIDEINIYQASKKAMIKAVNTIDLEVSFVLSDAMPLGELGLPYESIIKGDAKSASIAAASIIAKVTRDQYMVRVAEDYPVYGFEKHKGYPTKMHKEALLKHGACGIHRKTYAPVREVLFRQETLDLK